MRQALFRMAAYFKNELLKRREARGTEYNFIFLSGSEHDLEFGIFRTYCNIEMCPK